MNSMIVGEKDYIDHFSLRQDLVCNKEKVFDIDTYDLDEDQFFKSLKERIRKLGSCAIVVTSMDSQKKNPVALFGHSMKRNDFCKLVHMWAEEVGTRDEYLENYKKNHE